MPPAHRVLYVDDSEDNRVVFLHSFSRRFSVETVASGQEALDVIRRSSPEVIVTDQRMPGMSGIELLEAVREIDPKIRRLMITAFNDPEAVQHNGAGTCGCVEHHFMKPFDRAQVEAAMIPTLDDMAEKAERMLAATAKTLGEAFAADERRRAETAEIVAAAVEKVAASV